MATSPVDPPDPDARPATTAVSGAYVPAAGDEHAERRPPFDRFIRPLLPVGLRRVGQRRFPRLAAWFKRFGTSSVEPRRPVDEVIAQRFDQLRPLSVYPIPTAERRVTVVTDSLGRGSLFGGVATSMIFAAALAARLDASVRIVTRNEAPDASAFASILTAHERQFDSGVELLHSSGVPGDRGVPVHDGDIFVTTSWWSTWSVRQSVDPARILYLLQEDERLFYPAGDDQLRCADVLSDPRIRFVVNSEMLHSHLVASGLDRIAENGIWFEPAFPRSSYFREERDDARPKQFFFYARPNNVRNLFYRGIEAIRWAMVTGVLDPDEWSFHFAGRDIPPVVLPFGVIPRCSESVPWPEYAAIVRASEVGLALMSTPHPSYPPLDLAASGAIAVTNRYDGKADLDRYCRNIVCTDTSIEALTEGIDRAVRLAANEPLRAANFAQAGLLRSWDDAIATALDVVCSEV